MNLQNILLISMLFLTGCNYVSNVDCVDGVVYLKRSNGVLIKDMEYNGIPCKDAK